MTGRVPHTYTSQNGTHAVTKEDGRKVRLQQRAMTKADTLQARLVKGSQTLPRRLPLTDINLLHWYTVQAINPAMSDLSMAAGWLPPAADLTAS